MREATTNKKCTHEKYKSKNYMMYSNAVKAFNNGDVRIIGTRVIKCEDCGEDISHAQRVKIKNLKEAKQPTKKYNIIIRGKKSSMICYDGETLEEAKQTCILKFGKNFEGITE